MAFMCSGKKCSFVISVFVLALLVAVIWFVWFGTNALLGKGEIEKSVRKLSEQLSVIGDDYDREIKITHGAIQANAWDSSKNVILPNVNIEINGKAVGDTMNFKLALGDVTVNFNSSDHKKLLVGIPSPISIYHSDVLIYTLNFSEPLSYSYLQLQPDSPQSFQHSIIVPKKITLFSNINAPQQESAQDAIPAGDEKLSVAFAVNPTIDAVSTGEGDLSSLVYDLSGMTLANKEQKIISFGTLKSQFNEEDGDDEGRRVGKYSFVADDAVLYNGQAATKPYSVNVNTNLVFDAVKKGQSEEKTSADILKENFYNDLNTSQNRDVTLNNFTLSNPDFQLRATGKFSNVTGDPLPSGEVNVVIDNLQEFLGSELVAIEGRNMVESALTKIIGQSPAGQDRTSFVLKRQKNGVFYVGNTTFEELVASLVSGSMIGINSSGGGRSPEKQSPVTNPVSGGAGGGGEPSGDDGAKEPPTKEQ